MHSVRASRRSIVIALMMISAVGCSTLPDIAHPGPAAYQRARAIQHDPYPLNDVGPEIVGGRPLAYQQSINEVERARMGPLPPRIQPMAPPGTAAFAPPVVSSPFAVPPPQVAAPLSTTPAPIVTGPMPAATAPIVTSPYQGASAPIVTSPYPAPQVAPANPFPYQQRAPY